MSTGRGLLHAFLRGTLAVVPFFFVVLPFGMLFGVVATKAGLSLAQTMGFSLLVIAGASQLSAVQLMVEGAPFLIVVFTVLVINLRIAMYSATMTLHLGEAPLWKRIFTAALLIDQTFAASLQEYDREKRYSVTEKFMVYAGAAIPVVSLWWVSTCFGAVFGTQFPSHLPIAFILPLCFISIVGPTLQTMPMRMTALCSALLGLALAWVPYGFGLVVAAAISMHVGARLELWVRRRR